MKCEYCLQDSALMHQDRPCCQLRHLVNAPPHVIRTAETAAAQRGEVALRQFQEQLATEKKRLARLRQSRQQAVANICLFHLAQVLQDEPP